MPMTDAERLRAEGVRLMLGGEEVRIRFRFRGKAELEKRFGSVVAFEQKLNQALAANLAGPMVTVCLDGLAAALTGTSWTEERIDAAMEDDRLGEYLGAILAAWQQAWPAASKDDGQGNGEGTPASTSPGSDSSSSASSASASAQSSSGT